MTERVDIQTARKLPGLRLVITSGVPGPWGEAAKGLLHAKGISYARVDQAGGMPNDELIAWTGHGNAPQAIYQDERARIGWSELIFLAERLAPDPPLVPRDPELRLQMFGLIHEIAGENGFGWSRRLMMLHHGLQLPADAMGPMRQVFERLGNSYGYDAQAGDAAPKRVEDILLLLSARLGAQLARGSGFLIGDSLSAADIYWAAFAALLEPLPAEQCAMNEGLRGTYTMSDPVLRKAAAPSLLEHRDRIYRAHMELPIQL
jgi:glutathione S-transferase